MVTSNGRPEYDLAEVKTAAGELKIEFRGRKPRLDVLNLNYELSDVSLCLRHLLSSHYRKTIQYEDRPPDDEYICEFSKPGNEHLVPDRLYIKFCLVEDSFIIELGSFHLTRF